MNSGFEHEPLVREVALEDVKPDPVKMAPSYVRVVEVVQSLPREVWFMYTIKYLESYSFFILAYSLVLFLSEEFGFGDEQAAWVYGIYGTLISVYGLGMGIVIDSLGVRHSLLWGLSTLIVSRIILAYTRSTPILLLVLLTALPAGASLTLPALQIGIKRYTTDSNRSVAFSGYYIVMNLSAMAAAPCIDAFHRLVPSFNREMPLGLHLTQYRLLILAGALLSCASLAVAYKYIKSDEDSDSARTECSVDSFKHVFRSKPFWRFVLLAILFLGVRAIYRHLDATFPKYMVRNFGHDAPFGSLIALNPFCVVIVTLLATPLSMIYHPVPVIIVGAFISALSPFVLAMGHTYTNAIIFVLLLSIGEGIWSPRLYEYLVMVAEKGREGTFMALAAAPMYLASLLAGATSGTLLDRYSPEHGEKRPEIMWAIIGLTSVLSPVMMLFLKDVIMESPEEHRRRTEENLSRHHSIS